MILAKKSNLICLILTFIALGCLIPGVYKPVFKLSMNVSVDAKMASFSREVLNEERSILGTVIHLYEDQRYLVSGLVALFSLVIPLFKMVLVFFALSKFGKNKSQIIIKWIDKISKWSMADVLLIGILLAFLATSGSGAHFSEGIKVFGMNIPVKINAVITSLPGAGFYFFFAYCVVSMIATEFFKRKIID